MKPGRKYFGFRDDAAKWVTDNGFTYTVGRGWTKGDFRAIIEKTASPRLPWAACVYRSK